MAPKWRMLPSFMLRYGFVGLSLVSLVSLVVGCGGEEPPLTSVGCEGADLLVSPTDPAARGPAIVGAKTVTLAGLRSEIWYPAAGPTAAPKRYDIREALPESERAKIADEDNPFQTCNCFADLALDVAHGPYPIIVFIHGFGGYRAQSLEIVTHWASRGYVVVAAEHPGQYLADALAPACGLESPVADPETDVRAMLSELAAPTGAIDFLTGHLDLARVAVAGHSAGGRGLRDLGDVASLLVPMAAEWDQAPEHPAHVLVLGAHEDQVVPYSSQVKQYELAAPPKHLVGIGGTGHLAFSSLCSLVNDDGDDLVTIAQKNDVCGLSIAGALFDCDPSYLPPAAAWKIVGDATSSLLDARLQCHPEVARLSEIQSRHPEVADYREAL